MKKKLTILVTFTLLLFTIQTFAQKSDKTRVIVTSDGEIDDECSMVRFLLYANEWDIEGIITSSSQYHWHGHNWAGDDWIGPLYEAYAQVYPNLQLHDKNYPSPEYLKSVTFLGNVETEGEMALQTAGSEHIVKVLLDESDSRPVWLQAWGGTNTIARALKTIEEKHPEKMASVAQKLRFFFIWEQDASYQSYIRLRWARFNILTIISDQFEAIAYRWKKVQPDNMKPYFEAKWMKENILQNQGPLCAEYKAHDGKEKGFIAGDFRSEGDSPAFMHTIPTGLRNLENPDWGGWGGRYVKIRENTWLDPVPDPSYKYPEGRWYGSNGWGRSSLRDGSTATEEQRKAYFKPLWQWSADFQNDFAARADWCVKPFKEANHAPVFKTGNALNINAKAGQKINLKAVASDPDGDKLKYKWWQYEEVDSYDRTVKISNTGKAKTSFIVPHDTKNGDTIHLICEVSDNGSPSLTRYMRVIIEVK